MGVFGCGREGVKLHSDLGSEKVISSTHSALIIIYCYIFITDADEEIDEGPIVETNYVQEKGEEYLGQVTWTLFFYLFIYLVS